LYNLSFVDTAIANTIVSLVVFDCSIFAVLPVQAQNLAGLLGCRWLSPGLTDDFDEGFNELAIRSCACPIWQIKCVF